MLLRGQDVMCRDESGETPLHYTAWYGSQPVTALLLSHGVDVNARSRRFPTGTPLRWARCQKYAETVTYLLKKGAKEMQGLRFVD
jgi:ankyrin repeat protein